MAVITGKDKICGEICDALGLKHVIKLDLHMEKGSIVNIEVEYYPEDDGIKSLIPILKKFELVEKK